MAEKKTKEKTQNRAGVGVQELNNELRAALEKRGKLAFQHNVAPLKNPMELRELRRDIARLQTLIRQKEAVK